jgi:hypothetical protein
MQRFRSGLRVLAILVILAGNFASIGVPVKAEPVDAIWCFACMDWGSGPQCTACDAMTDAHGCRGFWTRCAIMDDICVAYGEQCLYNARPIK